MPDYTLQDFVIDTTEQILEITPVDKYLKSSIFVINKGDKTVTVRIYGSPTGATIEKFASYKSGYEKYSQSEINLHYILIAQFNVSPNDNHYLDLSDYVFDYFKITAETGSGETTINYKIQKAYSMLA